MRTLFLLLIGSLLAGCRDEQVTTYRIPKAAAQAAVSVPVVATVSSPPAGASPGLSWTAPAAWTPKPATAMRKGSYTVKGAGGAEADLSITAFPGAVGGELANINRWRGQVQLPEVAESQLDGVVTRFAQAGLHVTFVDFAGGGQRILGALVPAGATTWFFKLSGADEFVATEKPAFLAFLKTVREDPNP